MGYAIHLTRTDSTGQRVPIGLEEWRAAVESVQNVRLADGDARATNPRTGEVIVIRNSGGDAEVYFPESSTWFRTFTWNRTGRISFRAPQDWDNTKSQVRAIANALALKLGASLIGDEGEVYDSYDPSG